MAIIDTVRVNEKNTREVNTAEGTKLVMSYRLFPTDIYIGGIWLPKNVSFGDVVDIFIHDIKSEEKDGKTYYNASYPKASKNFMLSEQQENVYDDVHGGMAPNESLFGGVEPADIPDSELPF